LISVMQFAEGLTDRQAAEAVRSRIDWKYALGLEITDSGFDYSVLSEFRGRLIARGREHQILEKILEEFKQKGWLKSRGKARTDSTHVIAAIRQLNRLECVGETLRHCLNELATIAPEWLLSIVSQDWFDRYSHRFEQYRLPKTKAEQLDLALVIGRDGHQLLMAVYSTNTPAELASVSAVEILRLVWVQQYYLQGENLSWRTDDLPPNQLLIQSPYDIQARNRTKRNTNWTGYSVHLTETCDCELPSLITNVETTAATTFDGAMTPIIHQHLADKALLPQEHFVDTNYVSAQHLLDSKQNYQLELTGPVMPDTSWQAQSDNGFDLKCFTIDWHSQTVVCPAGHTSKAWCERIENDGTCVSEVRFASIDCRVCPLRAQCTRAARAPRLLKLRPQSQHQALQAARIQQATSEFKRRYQQRAGVEGAISQACVRFGLRRSRYIGLAKTHLQHLLTATAINLTRIVSWLEGIPKAKTRTSRFAALAPSAFT
jgi:transposase